MSGQSTPAGWYPDPQTPGQQRYWDGNAWSEATQPLGGAAPAPAYGQQVGYGYAQGAGATPANFGQRLAALLIDGVVLGVPFVIVLGILGAISDALAVLAYLAGLVGIVYYFGHFEGGPEGQTIGKRTMKIRTVDATTLQPGIGMGRAVGRYFAHIISGFVCYLGYLWMLWDPEKQTWHDKIVSTKVVTA